MSTRHRGSGLRFPVLTGVVRRVRRLTDEEIRKEYGLMERPFKSAIENIFWLLVEREKVTSADVSKEVGIKTPDAASRFTSIFKRLEPKGLLTRERDGLGYSYKLTDQGKQLTVSELYSEYSKTYKPPEERPVGTDNKRVGLEVINTVERTKIIIEVRGKVEILFGILR